MAVSMYLEIKNKIYCQCSVWCVNKALILGMHFTPALHMGEKILLKWKQMFWYVFLEHVRIKQVRASVILDNQKLKF